jgi:hypothetical protein
MPNYNRYSNFISNGQMAIVPFIKLEVKSTDKSRIWNKQIDRMDKISQAYYDHPFGGIFIMMANPQYGDEFDIPDGTLIRIPFPYKDTKQQYQDGVQRYINRSGL